MRIAVKSQFSVFQRYFSNYVASGTAYENVVKSRLSRWGLYLERVGGPHDKGIDLEGVWDFTKIASNASENCSVYVQCKDEGKRIGVGHIRSLDGALGHRRIQTRRQSERHFLGVFASSSGFTKPALDLHATLGSPLVLCTMNTEGHISQFLFNRKAQSLLPHVTVVDSYQLPHVFEEGTPDTVAIALHNQLLL